ncbi:hypothetical protein L6R52_26540, partial [Myxococcota bacterium]|nr:hypothetical protein [Myxococcota bacterium]
MNAPSISKLLALTALALAACSGDAPSGGPADAGDVTPDASCPMGQVGCACRANDRCATGLVCTDGLCTTCPEGQEGCACRATGDACDDGLACELGACAACTPGDEGCSCAPGGACGDGLFCTNEGVCGALTTCELLRASGGCPDSRECAVVNARPTCLDSCAPGYQRGTSGDCEPCGAGGCSRATCTPNVVGSISADCLARNQRCTEGADGAFCGACLDGFRANPVTGLCEDASTCGGRACGPDEEEQFDASGVCSCVQRACPSGQALRPDGTCTTCVITCDGAGETGGFASRTTNGGTCVCETMDGSFYEEASGTTQACDGDGDGWIRRDAHLAMTSTDLAVRESARCTLLRADRVALVNELGQRLTVWSCAANGLVASANDPCNGASAPIELVESQRNDVAALLVAAGRDDGTNPVRVPDYGAPGEGRAFRADELNALTRACVTQHGDFDDDGTPDLAASQPDARSVTTNARRLAALGFFVELHTSSFVPGPTPTSNGTLEIRERSRCTADFPVTYSAPSEYWRECHRPRDARFDASTPSPGFDFAQWSCASPVGTCVLPPIDGASEAAHGACNAAQVWTSTSAAWRGMHHHSQFQCGLVGTASPGSPEATFTFPEAVFDASAGWAELTTCALGASAPSCSARAATPGAVGMIATRYAPGAVLDVGGAALAVTSVRGCVDEGETFGAALCPEPVPPRIEDWYGAADTFGALVCSCDPAALRTYHPDRDGDGHGDPAQPIVTCQTLVAWDGAPLVTVGDDCDDADPTRAPSLPDVPDLGTLDANCDGVDGDASTLVFVSSTTGNDVTGNGRRGSPVQTIRRGLQLVGPSRRNLAIATGTYAEHFVLREDTGLYGGYDPMTWTRRLDRTGPRTLVRSNEVQANIRGVVAITAEDIRTSRPSVVQGVDLFADASAAPRGTSTYGLRALDAPGLRIEAATITAGTARPGGDGAQGTEGEDGGDGRNGGSGNGSVAGGSGGARVCTMDDGTQRITAGYGGGNGGRHDGECGDGNDGRDGDGLTGWSCAGGGGDSGGCFRSYSGDPGDDGSLCAISGINPAPGSDGLPAQSSGEHDRAGAWSPSSGSAGLRGDPGAGGGGGGGGGGDVANSGCNGGNDDGGGGGGGGGSGGCGGYGGRPGQ